MKRFALAFFALALSVSVAQADVPDPAFCAVDPSDALDGLLLCPEDPTPLAASINTVLVANSVGAPIENALVEIEVTALNLVCSEAVFSGNTDVNGEIVITLSGGGCAHLVASAGVVKANGVTIRDYQNAKSPDYDGASGNGVVDLTDLIKFSNEFLGVDANECHDYDTTGTTDLGDLITFSTAFLLPSTCP